MKMEGKKYKTRRILRCPPSECNSDPNGITYSPTMRGRIKTVREPIISRNTSTYQSSTSVNFGVETAVNQGELPSSAIGSVQTSGNCVPLMDRTTTMLSDTLNSRVVGPTATNRNAKTGVNARESFNGRSRMYKYVSRRNCQSIGNSETLSEFPEWSQTNETLTVTPENIPRVRPTNHVSLSARSRNSITLDTSASCEAGRSGCSGSKDPTTTKIPPAKNIPKLATSCRKSSEVSIKPQRGELSHDPSISKTSRVYNCFASATNEKEKHIPQTKKYGPLNTSPSLNNAISGSLKDNAFSTYSKMYTRRPLITECSEAQKTPPMTSESSRTRRTGPVCANVTSVKTTRTTNVRSAGTLSATVSTSNIKGINNYVSLRNVAPRANGTSQTTETVGFRTQACTEALAKTRKDNLALYMSGDIHAAENLKTFDMKLDEPSRMSKIESLRTRMDEGKDKIGNFSCSTTLCRSIEEMTTSTHRINRSSALETNDGETKKLTCDVSLTPFPRSITSKQKSQNTTKAYVCSGPRISTGTQPIRYNQYETLRISETPDDNHLRRNTIGTSCDITASRSCCTLRVHSSMAHFREAHEKTNENISDPRSHSNTTVHVNIIEPIKSCCQDPVRLCRNEQSQQTDINILDVNTLCMGRSPERIVLAEITRQDVTIRHQYTETPDHNKVRKNTIGTSCDITASRSCCTLRAHSSAGHFREALVKTNDENISKSIPHSKTGLRDNLIESVKSCCQGPVRLCKNEQTQQIDKNSLPVGNTPCMIRSPEMIGLAEITRRDKTIRPQKTRVPGSQDCCTPSVFTQTCRHDTEGPRRTSGRQTDTQAPKLEKCERYYKSFRANILCSKRRYFLQIPSAITTVENKRIPQRDTIQYTRRDTGILIPHNRYTPETKMAPVRKSVKFADLKAKKIEPKTSKQKQADYERIPFSSETKQSRLTSLSEPRGKEFHPFTKQTFEKPDKKLSKNTHMFSEQTEKNDIGKQEELRKHSGSVGVIPGQRIRSYNSPHPGEVPELQVSMKYPPTKSEGKVPGVSGNLIPVKPGYYFKSQVRPIPSKKLDKSNELEENHKEYGDDIAGEILPSNIKPKFDGFSVLRELESPTNIAGAKKAETVTDKPSYVSGSDGIPIKIKNVGGLGDKGRYGQDTLRQQYPMESTQKLKDIAALQDTLSSTPKTTKLTEDPSVTGETILGKPGYVFEIDGRPLSTAKPPESHEMWESSEKYGYEISRDDLPSQVKAKFGGFYCLKDTLEYSTEDKVVSPEKYAKNKTGKPGKVYRSDSIPLPIKKIDELRKPSEDIPRQKVPKESQLGTKDIPVLQDSLPHQLKYPKGTEGPTLRVETVVGKPGHVIESYGSPIPAVKTDAPHKLRKHPVSPETMDEPVNEKLGYVYESDDIPRPIKKLEELRKPSDVIPGKKLSMESKRSRGSISGLQDPLPYQHKSPKETDTFTLTSDIVIGKPDYVFESDGSPIPAKLLESPQELRKHPEEYDGDIPRDILLSDVKPKVSEFAGLREPQEYPSKTADEVVSPGTMGETVSRKPGYVYLSDDIPMSIKKSDELRKPSENIPGQKLSMESQRSSRDIPGLQFLIPYQPKSPEITEDPSLTRDIEVRKPGNVFKLHRSPIPAEKIDAPLEIRKHPEEYQEDIPTDIRPSDYKPKVSKFTRLREPPEYPKKTANDEVNSGKLDEPVTGKLGYGYGLGNTPKQIKKLDEFKKYSDDIPSVKLTMESTHRPRYFSRLQDSLPYQPKPTQVPEGPTLTPDIKHAKPGIMFDANGRPMRPGESLHSKQEWRKLPEEYGSDMPNDIVSKDIKPKVSDFNGLQESVEYPASLKNEDEPVAGKPGYVYESDGIPKEIKKLDELRKPSVDIPFQKLLPESVLTPDDISVLENSLPYQVESSKYTESHILAEDIVVGKPEYVSESDDSPLSVKLSDVPHKERNLTERFDIRDDKLSSEIKPKIRVYEGFHESEKYPSKAGEEVISPRKLDETLTEKSGYNDGSDGIPMEIKKFDELRKTSVDISIQKLPMESTPSPKDISRLEDSLPYQLESPEETECPTLSGEIVVGKPGYVLESDESPRPAKRLDAPYELRKLPDKYDIPSDKLPSDIKPKISKFTGLIEPPKYQLKTAEAKNSRKFDEWVTGKPGYVDGSYGIPMDIKKLDESQKLNADTTGQKLPMQYAPSPADIPILKDSLPYQTESPTLAGDIVVGKPGYLLDLDESPRLAKRLDAPYELRKLSEKYDKLPDESPSDIKPKIGKFAGLQEPQKYPSKEAEKVIIPRKLDENVTDKPGYNEESDGILLQTKKLDGLRKPNLDIPGQKLRMESDLSSADILGLEESLPYEPEFRKETESPTLGRHMVMEKPGYVSESDGSPGTDKLSKAPYELRKYDIPRNQQPSEINPKMREFAGLKQSQEYTSKTEEQVISIRKFDEHVTGEAGYVNGSDGTQKKIKKLDEVRKPSVDISDRKSLLGSVPSPADIPGLEESLPYEIESPKETESPTLATDTVVGKPGYVSESDGSPISAKLRGAPHKVGKLPEEYDIPDDKLPSEIKPQIREYDGFHEIQKYPMKTAEEPVREKPGNVEASVAILMDIKKSEEFRKNVVDIHGDKLSIESVFRPADISGFENASQYVQESLRETVSPTLAVEIAVEKPEYVLESDESQRSDKTHDAPYEFRKLSEKYDIPSDKLPSEIKPELSEFAVFKESQKYTMQPTEEVISPRKLDKPVTGTPIYVDESDGIPMKIKKLEELLKPTADIPVQIFPIESVPSPTFIPGLDDSLPYQPESPKETESPILSNDIVAGIPGYVSDSEGNPRPAKTLDVPYKLRKLPEKYDIPRDKLHSAMEPTISEFSELKEPQKYPSQTAEEVVGPRKLDTSVTGIPIYVDESEDIPMVNKKLDTLLKPKVDIPVQKLLMESVPSPAVIPGLDDSLPYQPGYPKETESPTLAGDIQVGMPEYVSDSDGSPRPAKPLEAPYKLRELPEKYDIPRDKLHSKMDPKIGEYTGLKNSKKYPSQTAEVVSLRKLDKPVTGKPIYVDESDGIPVKIKKLDELLKPTVDIPVQKLPMESVPRPTVIPGLVDSLPYQPGYPKETESPTLAGDIQVGMPEYVSDSDGSPRPAKPLDAPYKLRELLEKYDIPRDKLHSAMKPKIREFAGLKEPQKYPSHTAEEVVSPRKMDKPVTGKPIYVDESDGIPVKIKKLVELLKPTIDIPVQKLPMEPVPSPPVIPGLKDALPYQPESPKESGSPTFLGDIVVGMPEYVSESHGSPIPAKMQGSVYELREFPRKYDVPREKFPNEIKTKFNKIEPREYPLKTMKVKCSRKFDEPVTGKRSYIDESDRIPMENKKINEPRKPIVDIPYKKLPMLSEPNLVDIHGLEELLPHEPESPKETESPTLEGHIVMGKPGYVSESDGSPISAKLRDAPSEVRKLTERNDISRDKLASELKPKISEFAGLKEPQEYELKTAEESYADGSDGIPMVVMKLDELQKTSVDIPGQKLPMESKSSLAEIPGLEDSLLYQRESSKETRSSTLAGDIVGGKPGYVLESEENPNPAKRLDAPYELRKLSEKYDISLDKLPSDIKPKVSEFAGLQVPQIYLSRTAEEAIRPRKLDEPVTGKSGLVDGSDSVPMSFKKLDELQKPIEVLGGQDVLMESTPVPGYISKLRDSLPHQDKSATERESSILREDVEVEESEYAYEYDVSLVPVLKIDKPHELRKHPEDYDSDISPDIGFRVIKPKVSKVTGLQEPLEYPRETDEIVTSGKLFESGTGKPSDFYGSEDHPIAIKKLDEIREPSIDIIGEKLPIISTPSAGNIPGLTYEAKTARGTESPILRRDIEVRKPGYAFESDGSPIFADKIDTSHEMSKHPEKHSDDIPPDIKLGAIKPNVSKFSGLRESIEYPPKTADNVASSGKFDEPITGIPGYIYESDDHPIPIQKLDELKKRIVDIHREKLPMESTLGPGNISGSDDLLPFKPKTVIGTDTSKVTGDTELGKPSYIFESDGSPIPAEEQLDCRELEENPDHKVPIKSTSNQEPTPGLEDLSLHEPKTEKGTDISLTGDSVLKKPGYVFEFDGSPISTQKFDPPHELRKHPKKYEGDIYPNNRLSDIKPKVSKFSGLRGPLEYPSKIVKEVTSREKFGEVTSKPGHVFDSDSIPKPIKKYNELGRTSQDIPGQNVPMKSKLSPEDIPGMQDLSTLNSDLPYGSDGVPPTGKHISDGTFIIGDDLVHGCKPCISFPYIKRTNEVKCATNCVASSQSKRMECPDVVQKKYTRTEKYWPCLRQIRLTKDPRVSEHALVCNIPKMSGKRKKSRIRINSLAMLKGFFGESSHKITENTQQYGPCGMPKTITQTEECSGCTDPPCNTRVTDVSNSARNLALAEILDGIQKLDKILRAPGNLLGPKCCRSSGRSLSRSAVRREALRRRAMLLCSKCRPETKAIRSSTSVGISSGQIPTPREALAIADMLGSIGVFDKAQEVGADKVVLEVGGHMRGEKCENTLVVIEATLCPKRNKSASSAKHSKVFRPKHFKLKTGGRNLTIARIRRCAKNARKQECAPKGNTAICKTIPALTTTIKCSENNICRKDKPVSKKLQLRRHIKEDLPTDVKSKSLQPSKPKRSVKVAVPTVPLDNQ